MFIIDNGEMALTSQNQIINRATQASPILLILCTISATKPPQHHMNMAQIVHQSHPLPLRPALTALTYAKNSTPTWILSVPPVLSAHRPLKPNRLTMTSQALWIRQTPLVSIKMLTQIVSCRLATSTHLFLTPTHVTSPLQALRSQQTPLLSSHPGHWTPL